MRTLEINQLTFSIGEFHLQGILEKPLPQTKSVVLILHPHPVYGGEMSNPVVTTLARTFHEFDLATFRFNFRGVQTKTQFAGLQGALEDTIAASKVLENQDLRLIGLAGYSFGGSTALRFCTVSNVTFLVSVSSSLTLYQEGNYEVSNLSKITCPVLMIHGTSDLTVPFENVAQISSHIQGSITCVAIENEGHFYHSSLGRLHNEVKFFLQNQEFSRSV